MNADVARRVREAVVRDRYLLWF